MKKILWVSFGMFALTCILNLSYYGFNYESGDNQMLIFLIINLVVLIIGFIATVITFKRID